jgi:lipid A 3-O-deacylase
LNAAKTRFLKIATWTFALVVAFGSAELFAQTATGPYSSSAIEIVAPGIDCCGPASVSATPNSVRPATPVEIVQDNKLWGLTPFLNYGNGVADRSDFRFLIGGLEVTKPVTPVVHAGPLSGQFEFGGSIIPLWQAFTPAPHLATYNCTINSVTAPCQLPVGGGHYSGVSVVPVIFRWDFLTHSPRFQPWIQASAGVIYTTHKFPPDVLVPHGTPGGTSVWNFSPQGGIGLRYFTRQRRSIDFGVNAVHISSASLGDKNPGVNASIQLQVGYTFWK